MPKFTVPKKLQCHLFSLQLWIQEFKKFFHCDRVVHIYIHFKGDLIWLYRGTSGGFSKLHTKPHAHCLDLECHQKVYMFKGVVLKVSGSQRC